jgi:hypothetical protein
MKNAQARGSLQAGLGPRASQREVWREVAQTSVRHGVSSPTVAMHDVFERHREGLRAIADAVHMHCGQVGMLAAVGGRFMVLDHVSDVEAFACLHGRLVQGYALDALGSRRPPRRQSRMPGTSSGCCSVRLVRWALRSGWGRDCASSSAGSRGLASSTRTSS